MVSSGWLGCESQPWHQLSSQSVILYCDRWDFNIDGYKFTYEMVNKITWIVYPHTHTHTHEFPYKVILFIHYFTFIYIQSHSCTLYRYTFISPPPPFNDSFEIAASISTSSIHIYPFTMLFRLLSHKYTYTYFSFLFSVFASFCASRFQWFSLSQSLTLSSLFPIVPTKKIIIISFNWIFDQE